MPVSSLIPRAGYVIILLVSQLKADPFYGQFGRASNADALSTAGPDIGSRSVFLDRSLASLQLEANVAVSQGPEAAGETNLEIESTQAAGFSATSNPDLALGEGFQHHADNPSVGVLGLLMLAGAIWRAYHSPSYARWYDYFFGPLDEY